MPTCLQGAIVAVECPDRLIYGLQYHPEVMHSDRGTPTLRHFLLSISGMTPDWKIENILDEEMEKIRRLVRGCTFMGSVPAAGDEQCQACVMSASEVGGRQGPQVLDLTQMFSRWGILADTFRPRAASKPARLQADAGCAAGAWGH